MAAVGAATSGDAHGFARMAPPATPNSPHFRPLFVRKERQWTGFCKRFCFAAARLIGLS
jgi:hypothetical protein